MLSARTGILIVVLAVALGCSSRSNADLQSVDAVAAGEGPSASIAVPQGEVGDTSPAVVEAHPADSVVDDSTPPEFALVPLDQLDELDVDWLSKARGFDPELAERLPSEEAVGPNWLFSGMELNESQPAALVGERDRCGNSLGPRPYGLDVRFDLGSVSTLDLYREGSLDVILGVDDPALIDQYVEWRAKLLECIALNRATDSTWTAITDGLPEGTVAAYRLEFEPDEQEVFGEPIVFLTNATFLYVRRGGVVAGILVSATQMSTHPYPADSTREAIRIAHAISLDS